MTYYQGFGISSLDELTVSSAQFDEFMNDAYNLVHPIGAIYVSTVQLLRNAFWLAKQKATLAKEQYKELLKKLDWEGEEKRYLKVAAAFSCFTPEQLALVEPRTIFQIAENLKKYQSVITKIATLAQITQDKVRSYIQQCRKPRAKKEEKSNIWKTGADNKRFFEIPPMYDDATGVILEKIMESEGRSAQSVVAEGIALVWARFEGRIPADVIQNIEAPQNSDEEISTENVIEELLDDTNKAPVLEVPESSLGDEDVIEDSSSFESEAKKDDNIDDYNLLISPQYELAPVDFLVETFQKATTWQEINQVLNTHEEYKERAWSILTRSERRRVIEMTPPEIIELRNAKKNGLIVDFRELRTDVYEVQFAGSLVWE